MKAMLRLTLIFAAVLALPIIGAARAVPGSANAISKINADFDNGIISIDQRAELIINAIKSPDKLASRYRQATSDGVDEEIDCPTMAIRDVVMAWDQLSPATQGHFSQAFARPGGANLYVTPDGKFTFHYDITGTNAVPSADLDFSGTPDFVEHCAAYLDTTLQKHLAIGYTPPISDGANGGDSSFDIYFEDMGYYGYAVPEGPGPAAWNDYYCYLVLNNNFIGFPTNHDPEGNQLGAAKVTVAHEFHHCIQFSYDATEYEWYMELDATYMEDIVYNLTDDNYNYLPSFFSAPQTSLMASSIREYACFIWGMYLSQKFDTTLNRAVWEGAKVSGRTVYQALSDTLLARYGWTQDSAFADFEVWNFITSTRDDGMHHDEASAYPAMTIGRTHSIFPVVTQSSPGSPGGYAASYVQFLPSGNVGTLQITVDGADSREWKFYVIKSTSENSHQVSEIVAPGPSYSGSISISNVENYTRVALVGVNLTEFSAAATYSYGASILPDYQVASSVVSTDSIIYPGGTRNVQIQLSNPSTVADIYSVFPSDDQGWITSDSLDFALGAGKDTTFTVPVHPPTGTGIGQHATLTFASRSWGNNSVVDTITADYVTVLYHGDANSNGVLNVVDLNYMVAYFFLGGAAPIPVVESADFNCNGIVDVVDLNAAVAYFFLGGSPPTCNPY